MKNRVLEEKHLWLIACLVLLPALAAVIFGVLPGGGPHPQASFAVIWLGIALLNVLLPLIRMLGVARQVEATHLTLPFTLRQRSLPLWPMWGAFGVLLLATSRAGVERPLEPPLGVFGFALLAMSLTQFLPRKRWVLFGDHLSSGVAGNEIYYRNLSRVEIRRESHGKTQHFQLQLSSRYLAEPHQIWLQDFKPGDVVAMLRLLRELAPQAEMNEMALRFADGEVPLA